LSVPATARLTVDLDALAHNHLTLRRAAGTAEVAPVVKSDGYGLGAAQVGMRLWAEGARRFFVARLSEGEALRSSLTGARDAVIHVLDGLTEGSSLRMAAARLTPVLSTADQVRTAVQEWPRGMDLALNFDTGMGRQGLSPDQAEAAHEALSAFHIDLVMSHLGSAANPESPRNHNQLQQFLAVRRQFPDARASLAASAGIFLGPDYHFDIVRPGVSLFGGGPLERPHPDLRAVATFTAPILDIRDLRAGDILGYGESVRMAAPTRVAVVAAGYADGVIRATRKGGYAWFAGARRRLLIVNMDILVIELGDAPAAVGDDVELLGANALLDDQAEAAGTVAHEVLVRMSRRASWTYLGEAV
jgi:alanine racemase